MTAAIFMTLLLSRDPNCCGPGCRAHDDTDATLAHYDRKYLESQNKISDKKARNHDWAKHLELRAGETVADFGAGNGAILDTLKALAGKRVAVEYSSVARRYLADVKPDISTYRYVEDVPDDSVDVFLSTSVIEHLECPVQEMREMRAKLRAGGRIVIGVKNEAVELWRGWNANNRDNHLYTWNSMLLGNVLRASGFVIDRITSPPRKQLEASLVENGFGTKRHSFQYLWAYAHKPRPGDAWPQNGTTRFISEEPGGPSPTRGRGRAGGPSATRAGGPSATRGRGKDF